MCHTEDEHHLPEDAFVTAPEKELEAAAVANAVVEAS
jgi:hypothetical protein